MGNQSSMIRPSAKGIKSWPHLCAETQYAEHPVMQSFTGTSLVGGTDGTVSSDVLYMNGGGRYPDLFNSGDGSQLRHPYLGDFVVNGAGENSSNLNQDHY